MCDITDINKVRQQRLEEASPHLTGEAHCSACFHEWVATTPVGQTWLECPSCHAFKGLLTYPYEPANMIWSCTCGNDLFFITPGGAVCPACGKSQELG